MNLLVRSALYQYFINLNERGGFYADVRDPNNQSVFYIEGLTIFEAAGCATAAIWRD